MTSRWTLFSQAIALTLLLLGVSPFTAPFSTCGLAAPEEPHGLPFERAIHKDPLSKVNEATTLSLALAERIPTWRPTLETIGVSPAPGLQPIEGRRRLHAVLRV